MFPPKAFTLAELLVATSILAIMAAVTVFAVRNVSSVALVESIRNKTLSSVADFDRAVRDGALGSYEMAFTSGALGTVAITDFSGLSASGTLTSYDWVATSGTFRISAPASGQWTVRLAQDNKIVGTVSVSAATATVPFKFDTGRRDSYSASFFYASQPENRIVMQYFDRDGPVVEEQSRLKFVSVAAGTSEYGNFVIRNVL